MTSASGERGLGERGGDEAVDSWAKSRRVLTTRLGVLVLVWGHEPVPKREWRRVCVSKDDW